MTRLLLALLLLASTAAAQVVPQPQSFELEDGGPIVGNRIRCSVPEFMPQAEALVVALQRLGAKDVVLVDADWRSDLAPVDGDSRPLWKENNPIAVDLVEGPPRGVELYRTYASGHVLSLAACTPQGAARVVATALQLVSIEDGICTWPRARIKDQPTFPYRSFMVDMGRNPHSPATLRAVVDMLWLFKGNLLQLHLTDDQLFSWQSRAFPKLYSERAGWTWQDFVELEAYAAARGVAIVPELDVPGHSTILRREYPDVFGTTPTDLASTPEAQAGVETLIDELLEVFPRTPYIHIGGDEAYGVPEDIQRDFINRLDAHVRSKGKRTVVWEGPRLGEGEGKVDERVLHMAWRTVNVPAQRYLDAGYEVVNAAWDPMYVVDHYPRTMFTAVDLERCYGWNPQRFGHIDPGMSPFAEPHLADTTEGILGFCMPWWEGREQNLLPLCAPRFAALAARAWGGSGEDDFEDFLIRLGPALERFEAIADYSFPALPYADPASEGPNLAYRGPVSVSAGEHQPHFSPARLTNGITDRFDHFLGFPTIPEPLELTVELLHPAPAPPTVGRVVVHETAVGDSYELYELFVSGDGGATWTSVGETAEGTRGEATFVEHRFDPRPVSHVRVVTHGCKNLTFPSFSRLCEVEAFPE